MSNSKAYATAGDPTNFIPSDGNRLVVSADKGNGSFTSKTSTAYMYVPIDQPVARVTVDNILNGWLFKFAVLAVNEQNNVVAVTDPYPGPVYITQPVNGDTLVFNTDQPGIQYEAGVNLVTDGVVTYKVFAVQIATSDSPAFKGHNSNVTARLISLTPGVKIGVYAGPAADYGTGFFTSTPGTKWNETLAFAPTCVPPPGYNDNINLYDLDNGWSQGYKPTGAGTPAWTIPSIELSPPTLAGNIWVNLEKINRRTGASAGFADLVGVIEPTPSMPNKGYLTQGNYWYGTPNNATWWVRPADGYDPAYKYVLTVGGIGGQNKIRIRIPYDQINASFDCAQFPVGQVSISCTQITGTGIIDPDDPYASLQVTIWLDQPRSASGTPVETINTSPGGGFTSTDITRYIGYKSHTVYAYVGDIDASGTRTGEVSQLTGSPLTLGPCVSCGAVTTSPGAPEAERSFSVQVSFVYSAGGNPANTLTSVTDSADTTAGRFKVVLMNGTSGPALWNSAPPPQPFTPSPLGLGVDTIGTSAAVPVSAKPGDTYRVRWNVTDSTGANLMPANCTGRVTVGDLPYFRIYGGDIITGGAIDKSPLSSNPFGAVTGLSCDGTTRNSGAVIRAFNRSNAGSATQFIAQALGNITGFVSATGRGSPPTPAKGLTLSNTQGDATYGGTYGAAPCIPDYFGYLETLQKAGSVATNAGATLNLNPGLFASGTSPYFFYYKPNNPSKLLTLSSVVGGEIGAGRKVAIYVDGDVQINSDITFANASNAGRSFADIPSFYLIVRGNIYVQSNVKQLDGVYVALPATTEGCAVGQPTCTDTTSTYNKTTDNPASGVVYTCASGTTVSGNVNASLSFSKFLQKNCAQKLTFNGAVQATQLRLLRTNGSLRYSQGGAAEPSTSSNIAEVFNYSPEMLMGSPFPPPSGVVYDSIGSLAPTL